MAHYLEFANLYQAKDQKIADFVEKTGPLGFDIFRVPGEGFLTGFFTAGFMISWVPGKGLLVEGLSEKWIAEDPLKVQPTNPMIFIDDLERSIKALKEGYKPSDDPVDDIMKGIFDPESLLSNMRYFEQKNSIPYQENPDNVRIEAETMRLTMILYRMLSDYRRSNDAKSFAKEAWKIVLDDSVSLFGTDDLDKKALFKDFQDASEKELIDYAKWLEGYIDKYLPVIFDSAVKGVTFTVTKNFTLDYKPSCLMADLWYQLVRDLLSYKQTPVICDRCGRLFMSARPWGKSCETCRKAGKQHRYRGRVAKNEGRELRSAPGRPPKNGVTKRSQGHKKTG